MTPFDYFALGFAAGAVALYLLLRRRVQRAFGEGGPYQITERPPDPPGMRPGGCGVTTAGPIPPGTPPGRPAPPPRKP